MHRKTQARILVLLVALIALLGLDFAMGRAAEGSAPPNFDAPEGEESFDLPMSVQHLLRAEHLARRENLAHLDPRDASELRAALAGLAEDTSRVMYHEIRILEILESTQLLRVYALRSDPMTRALIRGTHPKVAADHAAESLRARALPGFTWTVTPMPAGWTPGRGENESLQALIHAMGDESAPPVEDDDELLLDGTAGATIRMLRMTPKELLLCLSRMQEESDEPARERQAVRLAAHVEIMGAGLVDVEERWIRLEDRCRALEAAGRMPRLTRPPGDYREVPYPELVTRLRRLSRS